ncbi:MAG: hypothetical protein EBR40_10675 [Proteobacteria bacterium]|nr:hypothetical protein [Pseudomonadota bacterium]
MKLKTTALSICLIVTGCESHQESQAIYDAWCRMNRRTDLSFSDWSILRNHDMLPGQAEQKAIKEAQAAQMMSAAAIGVSAAGAVRCK